MNLTTEMIQSVWGEMLRRIETIKAAGGVAMWEVAEGKPIPDGYVLDRYTEYFVPPNLFLDEHETMQ